MTTPAPNTLETLQLKQDDVLLGKLEVSELDFPWIICKFQPTEDFVRVKSLFDEELQLVNDADSEWEQAYEKILALDLQLIDVRSKSIIVDFLLHIEDDTAWFRY
jgi:hypothetical protein